VAEEASRVEASGHELPTSDFSSSASNHRPGVADGSICAGSSWWASCVAGRSRKAGKVVESYLCLFGKYPGRNDPLSPNLSLREQAAAF